MKTILCFLALSFAFAAQAEINCELSSMNFSSRQTQTKKIKIEEAVGGKSGSSTVGEINGFVLVDDQANVTMRILKYNTSSRTIIENIKIPKNQQDGTTLHIELPQNDRAWITCTNR